MTVWPLRPNWKDPYRVTLEFSTEIIASESGKEQRRARRQTPRKTVEFTVTTWIERFRAFMRTVEKVQGDSIYLPEIPRAISIELALGNTVTVVDVPDWCLVGADVFLIDPATGEDGEKATVESIIGGAITMTEDLVFSRPAGTKMCPALAVRLQGDQAASQITDRVLEASMSFAVDPGSEIYPELPEPAVTWNGREVFLDLVPNRAEDQQLGFNRGTRFVDYGLGVIRGFQVQAFGSTVRQIDYLLKSRADVVKLVNFYLRMKGRRGEFYAPSDSADIVIILPTTSAILTVAGTDTATAYADDVVRKAVSIKLKNGTRYFRAVTDVTVSGSNSQVHLDGIVEGTLAPEDVEVISWLPVCRLASDELTVEWQTDQIATARVNHMTLEALPAE